MSFNSDTKVNRGRVRNWCNTHKNEYDNSTQLSEGCCESLDLYEDNVEWKIPEWLFEIAGEILPSL